MSSPIARNRRLLPRTQVASTNREEYYFSPMRSVRADADHLVAARLGTRHLLRESWSRLRFVSQLAHSPSSWAPRVHSEHRGGRRGPWGWTRRSTRRSTLA